MVKFRQQTRCYMCDAVVVNWDGTLVAAGRVIEKVESGRLNYCSAECLEAMREFRKDLALAQI